ncbi:MAG: hypothetical protein FJZ80_06470 [Bacteroidetes bacterium]|nr:hypothetical protein [Bacteroidota bacterium]
MTSIGDRISFVDHGQKITIVILPKKQPIAIALMGSWLAMWLTIGVVCIWSLFMLLLNEQERIILWVFLTFWGYYAFRVSRSFLWLVWGQEFLKMDNLGIHLKKSLRNYGQSIPYYYENIKGLTYEVPDEQSFQSIWELSPWIQGDDRFQFEYFGKIVKFGKKLSLKEAQLLSKVIEKKMHKHAK